jgi:hypothetical protein
MIRCNNCGTNNIDGSDYCDECGMKLDVALGRVPSTRDNPQPIFQPPSAVQNDPIQSITIEGPPPTPPSFTTSTAMPKPATPARNADRITGARDAVPSRRQSSNDRASSGNNNSGERRSEPKSQTFILSSRGRTDALRSDSGPSPANNQRTAIADNLRATAKLVIERGGRVGRDFSITGIETNIGRWDADSGIFPDVDLDEDDPEAKVSRRHARIVNHEGEFFIEDLGSTNGTFVNRGRRLLPGKRHMLQNGDEIIVGKTFLKFQILR